MAIEGMEKAAAHPESPGTKWAKHLEYLNTYARNERDRLEQRIAAEQAASDSVPPTDQPPGA